MELNNKKALVVGLARTGISVAEFLLKKGARVRVSDLSKAELLAGNMEKLSNLDIEIETGRHTEEWFTGADIIVVSPGVPSNMSCLKAAAEKGVEIISEIELACRFIKEPVIAITGTNGKTTTTTLIGEISRKAGRSVFVGGNIGNPLIDYVMEEKKAEIVVAEISSFQLEGIRDFRPHISILLNITEDHLDRYASMAEYTEAKARIFSNQLPGDFAVMNMDDTIIRGISENLRPRRIGFSREHEIVDGIYFKDNYIFSRISGENIYDSREFRIVGGHNIENAMAAIAASELCGLKRDEITETLSSFHGLPHRVEFVAEVGGVSYYNDSKGTNIGAAMVALAGFKGNVILLAGGKDKGGDYSVMSPLIKEKVKSMVLFGEARHKIMNSIGMYTETMIVEDLKEAMVLVKKMASPGDVVLLSPACSSFDQFSGYAERGNRFKKFVSEISTSVGNNA